MNLVPLTPLGCTAPSAPLSPPELPPRSYSPRPRRGSQGRLLQVDGWRRCATCLLLVCGERGEQVTPGEAGRKEGGPARRETFSAVVSFPRTSAGLVEFIEAVSEALRRSTVGRREERSRLTTWTLRKADRSSSFARAIPLRKSPESSRLKLKRTEWNELGDRIVRRNLAAERSLPSSDLASSQLLPGRESLLHARSHARQVASGIQRETNGLLE